MLSHEYTIALHYRPVRRKNLTVSEIFWFCLTEFWPVILYTIDSQKCGIYSQEKVFGSTIFHQFIDMNVRTALGKFLQSVSQSENPVNLLTVDVVFDVYFSLYC